MEKLKIDFLEHNFDLQWDKEKTKVTEKNGNLIIGGLVGGGCGLVELIFTIILISQIVDPTPKSQITAMVVTLIIFLLPTLWGISQFFKRRIVFIDGDKLSFEFVSLFGTKQKQIPLLEYQQINWGQTSGASIYDGTATTHSSTSYYFLHLRHKNSRYAVELYNNIQNDMPEKRRKEYAKLLGLSVVDVSFKTRHNQAESSKRLGDFVKNRNKS